MRRYIFAYRFEEAEGEVFLRVHRLSGIVSALAHQDYRRMSREERQNYVTDAVLTELQAIIATKAPVPEGDEALKPGDDGAVFLSIQQSIKLELFLLYKSEFKSVAEFARHLGKLETSVRRMLDLRHRSSVSEIEDAMEALGRRLVLTWETELLGPTKHKARPAKAAQILLAHAAG